MFQAVHISDARLIGLELLLNSLAIFPTRKIRRVQTSEAIIAVR